MMTRLLALTLLLPFPLLACGGGGGDIPGPGCNSVQTSVDVTFSPPMTAGSGDLTQCLGRAPSISAEGAASCIALHATRATGSACACPENEGLQKVSAEHKSAVGKFLDPKTGAKVEASCVCEVKQLLTASDPGGLAACQKEVKNPVLTSAGQPVHGYCALDPARPEINIDLLSSCASGQKGGIRFVGRPAVQQPDDLSVVLLCATEDCTSLDE
ncbi:MAG: hypothetical protein ABI134_19985 [Byssovorax sp.]